jgi:hypothetical protein
MTVFTLFLRTNIILSEFKRTEKAMCCEIAMQKCLVLCRSLFACFLWAIVLSALLRFTVSDYTFGIFKLFLKQRRWIEIVSCHCTVALHYHFIRVTFNFQKRKFTIEHFCITMNYITLHRKLKDRTTRTPLKTRGELRCSWKDGTCCSTNFYNNLIE